MKEDAATLYAHQHQLLAVTRRKLCQLHTNARKPTKIIKQRTLSNAAKYKHEAEEEGQASGC